MNSVEDLENLSSYSYCNIFKRWPTVKIQDLGNHCNKMLLPNTPFLKISGERYKTAKILNFCNLLFLRNGMLRLNIFLILVFSINKNPLET